MKEIILLILLSTAIVLSQEEAQQPSVASESLENENTRETTENPQIIALAQTNTKRIKTIDELINAFEDQEDSINDSNLGDNKYFSAKPSTPPNHKTSYNNNKNMEFFQDEVDHQRALKENSPAMPNEIAGQDRLEKIYEEVNAKREKRNKNNEQQMQRELKKQESELQDLDRLIKAQKQKSNDQQEQEATVNVISKEDDDNKTKLKSVAESDNDNNLDEENYFADDYVKEIEQQNKAKKIQMQSEYDMIYNRYINNEEQKKPLQAKPEAKTEAQEKVEVQSQTDEDTVPEQQSQQQLQQMVEPSQSLTQEAPTVEQEQIIDKVDEEITIAAQDTKESSEILDTKQQKIQLQQLDNSDLKIVTDDTNEISPNYQIQKEINLIKGKDEDDEDEDNDNDQIENFWRSMQQHYQRASTADQEQVKESLSDNAETEQKNEVKDSQEVPQNNLNEDQAAEQLQQETTQPVSQVKPDDVKQYIQKDQQSSSISAQSSQDNQIEKSQKVDQDNTQSTQLQEQKTQSQKPDNSQAATTSDASLPQQNNQNQAASSQKNSQTQSASNQQSSQSIAQASSQQNNQPSSSASSAQDSTSSNSQAFTTTNSQAKADSQSQTSAVSNSQATITSDVSNNQATVAAQASNNKAAVNSETIATATTSQNSATTTTANAATTAKTVAKETTEQTTASSSQNAQEAMPAASKKNERTQTQPKNKIPLVFPDMGGSMEINEVDDKQNIQTDAKALKSMKFAVSPVDAAQNAKAKQKKRTIPLTFPGISDDDDDDSGNGDTTSITVDTETLFGGKQRLFHENTQLKASITSTQQQQQNSTSTSDQAEPQQIPKLLLQNSKKPKDGGSTKPKPNAQQKLPEVIASNSGESAVQTGQSENTQTQKNVFDLTQDFISNDLENKFVQNSNSILGLDTDLQIQKIQEEQNQKMQQEVYQTQAGPMPEATLVRANEQKHPSMSTADQALSQEEQQKFRELLETKMREDVKKEVSEVAIQCNSDGAYSKAVKHTCDLCNSKQAYLLNEENWFKIGLANNQQKEYSALLTEVSELFPGASIYASFSSKGEICLSSDDLPEKITVDKVLTKITGNGLASYQLKPALFTIAPMVQAELFKVMVKFVLDNSKNKTEAAKVYSGFQLIIQGDYTADLTETVQLSITKIALIQQNLTVIYLGQIATSNNLVQKVHFQQDEASRVAAADPKAGTTLDIIFDLPQSGLSLVSVTGKFFGEENSRQILGHVKLTRGVSELHHIRVEKMTLSYDSAGKSFKVLVHFKNVLSFAISPQLFLKECVSWATFAHDNVNGTGYFESMHMHCIVDRLPQYAYVHITKTQESEIISIKLQSSELSLQQFNSDILKVLCDDKEPGYTKYFGRLLDFPNTFAHEIHIQVLQMPHLVYYIDFKMGVPGWANIALADIVIANVNQKMTSFAQIHIGPEPLENIFKKALLFRYPQALTPKSTYIFSADYEVDLTSMSFLNHTGFGPFGEAYWSKGLYLQHIFDLDKSCQESAACSFLQNQKAVISSLHVKGYWSIISPHDGGSISGGTVSGGTVSGGTVSGGSISGSIESDSKKDQSAGSNSKEASKVKKNQAKDENKKTKNGTENGSSSMELVLSGSIDDLQLAKDLKLTSCQIRLPIIIKNFLQQKQRSLQQLGISEDVQSFIGNNSVEDFWISGTYQLPIGKKESLANLIGLIKFQDGVGFLHSESKQGWPNAFGQNNFQFNQLQLKGHFDEKGTQLDHYTMTALSVIGGNCFSQNNKSELLFNMSNCFYGNVHVNLDFADLNNSFYQGYYLDVSMRTIISIFVYPQNQLEERVSKLILDTRFPKGIIMSYAFKDATDDKGIKIPAGTTIQGPAVFMGLHGNLILNIQKGQALGVFHFSTTSFAANNIVIFEKDLQNSSNIVLSFGNQTNLDKEKQVVFKVAANIFNEENEIQLLISQTKGYRIDLEGKFFSSVHPLKLQLTAPYNPSLYDAQFQIQSFFGPDQLLELQKQLQNMTTTWMNKTMGLLEQFDVQIQHVEQILLEKKSKICDQSMCKEEAECVGLPKKQCLEYKKKKVCQIEEEYCLNVQEQCVRQRKICLQTEKVCEEWDDSTDDGKGMCLKYIDACISQIELCQEWKSVCVGDKIKACAEQLEVDDTEQCLQYIYTCEMQYMLDRTCTQECKRRNQGFEAYNSLYTQLIQKKEEFDRKVQGFRSMYNEQQSNAEGFIQIVQAMFQKEVKAQLNPKGFNVEFKIISFTKQSSTADKKTVASDFLINNYNFADETLMMKNLFNSLTIYWSTKFNFDPVILKQDASQIIYEVFGQQNSTSTGKISGQTDPKKLILYQIMTQVYSKK